MNISHKLIAVGLGI